MQSVLILSVKEERRERMTGKEGRENKEIDSLVACFLKNDQLPILCIEVCSDSEEEMESMRAGSMGRHAWESIRCVGHLPFSLGFGYI